MDERTCLESKRSREVTVGSNPTPSVMKNFFQLEEFQSLIDWLFSSGLKIVFILISALVLNRLGRKFIARAVRKALKLKDHVIRTDKKREETLMGIFSATLSSIIWLMAILMILPEFGIDTRALFAGAGIIGLAIGIGARKLIEDYIAGVFIILEDHYRVGDEVKISGIEGKVLDVSLRRTILRDKEGKIHFVPHGQIKISSRESR